MNIKHTQRPRYPAIGLREAAEKIEVLFKKEHRSPMSPETATHHLGFKGLNGSSLRIVAALRKYGLLEGRGHNLVITDGAISIIADKGIEGSQDRAEALKHALSSDPLFDELNNRFEGKASEVNLVSHLTKKGFKPDSAKMAASSYLDSVAFVNEQLGEYNLHEVNAAQRMEIEQLSGMGRHTKDDKKLSVTDSRITKHDQPENNMREVQIPLPGVTWPILKAEIPMSHATWDQLIAMLQAMKPALVTDKKQSDAKPNRNSDESEDVSGTE